MTITPQTGRIHDSMRGGSEGCSRVWVRVGHGSSCGAGETLKGKAGTHEVAKSQIRLTDQATTTTATQKRQKEQFHSACTIPYPDRHYPVPRGNSLDRETSPHQGEHPASPVIWALPETCFGFTILKDWQTETSRDGQEQGRRSPFASVRHRVRVTAAPWGPLCRAPGSLHH